MKRAFVFLLLLFAGGAIAAGPIRALLFDSEAACAKALVWLHANGSGDIAIFTNAYPEHTGLPARAGISGYSATHWNEAANCKHATSNLWAIPMNDHRIDAMLAQRPDLTNEFRLLFPTNGFQAIDASFWRGE